MSSRKVMIDEAPFADFAPGQESTPWFSKHEHWPFFWVAPDRDPDVPYVIHYRCVFRLPEKRTVRLHVTGDERYDLWCDGEPVGEGPERCDPDHWAYETYELDLRSGRHVLVARVWTLGPSAPWPQTRLHHGFLCAPQDDDLAEALGTGRAKWQWRQDKAWNFTKAIDPESKVLGMGSGNILDASKLVKDWPKGKGRGWRGVITRESGNNGHTIYVKRPDHRLRPARLPVQRRATISTASVVFVDDADVERAKVEPVELVRNFEDERKAWNDHVHSSSAEWTVPPNTTRRVILDLGQYACWFPEMIAHGAGARIEMTCCEAPFVPPAREFEDKDLRNVVDGRLVLGLTDVFLPGREPARFRPLWWRAGRYVQLAISAGDEPLTIECVRFEETGYPLDIKAAWDMEDPAMDDIARIAIRTQQCCLHETFMDCPHYEQLQYIGDTRIQALLVHALTADDTPVRSALHQFAWSRAHYSGFTTSSYPVGDGQLIPPFSLLWVGMIHDDFMWSDGHDELKTLLPDVRALLDAFLRHIDADGALVSPFGWNYFDWDREHFDWGTPPGAEPGGRNATYAWLLVGALNQASEMERILGDPDMARRWERSAKALAAATHRLFWREDENGYAESETSDLRTRHAQVMAYLSGGVPAACREMLADRIVHGAFPSECGIMFSHYRFLAAQEIGAMSALRPMWQQWTKAIEQGFTTFPEHWGETRSDCHAWSSHPLYHYLAGVAGIRPLKPGFRKVSIAPQPDDGETVDVSIPHPAGGAIAVKLKREGNRLTGSVELPDGVPGVLRWGGEDREISGRAAL